MNTKSNNPIEKSVLFKDCQIYILPTGLGKKRLTLFETQITNHGGSIAKQKGGIISATHIIVEDSLFQDKGKCISCLNGEKVNICANVKIVGTQWLSTCLKENKHVNTTEFEMWLSDKEIVNKPFCVNSVQHSFPGACSNVISDNSDTSHEDLISEACSNVVSGNNDKSLQDSLSEACTSAVSDNNDRSHHDPYIVEHCPPKKLKLEVIEKFGCSHASKNPNTVCNQVITNELKKLADAFRNSGDHWRAHGYEKAIMSIKKYGKEIKSFEEAVALDGVGQKMADKVLEILESGKLHKVEEICNSEKVKVLDLFTKVWGAGPSTAEAWYLQGLRTLEDLKTKATLTKQQKIGLEYYDDIQDQIPRHEVELIGAVVRDAALAIEPSLNVVLCGSYRRGKVTCGDIDVLICKNHRVCDDILIQLLTHLKGTGFITNDLVSVENNGHLKKYLGLCCLPGENRKHRRIDIFVVPQAEFAPALMHYTGSALFNRSIRLLASKKGMSLTEHSLSAGIVRQGKDAVNCGYILATPTEESIFQHLELPYRSPEER